MQLPEIRNRRLADQYIKINKEDRMNGTFQDLSTVNIQCSVPPDAVEPYMLYQCTNCFIGIPSRGANPHANEKANNDSKWLEIIDSIL
jgi:hypothetical protein